MLQKVLTKKYIKEYLKRFLKIITKGKCMGCKNPYVTDQIHRYWVDDRALRKSRNYFPQSAVEAVIEIGGRAVLVQRNEEPARNEWWLPGGRIIKAESHQNAVRRVAYGETGLDCNIIKLIGVFEHIFMNTPSLTSDGILHYHVATYLLKPKCEDYTIVLDETSAASRLVKKEEIEDLDLHLFMRRSLTFWRNGWNYPLQPQDETSDVFLRPKI